MYVGSSSSSSSIIIITTAITRYSTLGTYLYELAGVVGNQEHGFGYSQQKPLQLAVQGVINNLTHACSKSKNAFGPFEFCWSAPSFDGVIPDDDPPSSSHFTVTLPTGSSCQNHE